jgi:predicted AlkP superfamily phosphohydrolase/phosphomutase
MKRTLLIGFDAACWEYLNPLLHAGRLPTLQQLMDAGIWGTLHSTMPAHTPTAWASIVTGKNPGKHGVYDHLWRRTGTYEYAPTNARLRMGTPFWLRLSEHGLRVGLVNVPFTHPPDSLNGFVVGGFGTPAAVSDITYPSDLLGEIEEYFGHYEPAVLPSFIKTASAAEIFSAEGSHQKQQVKIANRLARQFEVDILVINLMFLDHANHYLSDMSQVEEAICQSDADLTDLILGFEPDNVIVFSDHGSRRVDGTFLLHAWLRDQGYCVQIKRSPSERSGALNYLLLQLINNRLDSTGSVSKSFRLLGKNIIPKLPFWALEWFWNQAEQFIPFAREHVIFSEDLDYERTSVYPGSSFSGLLYVNLLGREPMGKVSSEDCLELIDELIEKISQIPDPQTELPLISNIFRSEDIYHGLALASAPDLVLDIYEASCNVMTNFRRGPELTERRNKYFIADKKEFGRHSREGMFVFSGQDFNNGAAQHEAQVLDIPPTLLNLYDIPIPEDFDGRSLTELMVPEFVSRHPIGSQPGDPESLVSDENLYSKEETDELMERLRSLGYIE